MLGCLKDTFGQGRLPYSLKEMALLRFSQEHDDLESPSYAHPGDAGFDICAAVPESGIWIGPNSVVDIPTGLRFEIPPGYEIQIRPRSGLSKSLRILNAPGTVDCGYRGEVKVRVAAQPWTTVHIKRGERIAQAVLAPVYQAILERIPEVSLDTTRAESGFGSTGR